jgi:hypothetical protein
MLYRGRYPFPTVLAPLKDVVAEGGLAVKDLKNKDPRSIAILVRRLWCRMLRSMVMLVADDSDDVHAVDVGGSGGDGDAGDGDDDVDTADDGGIHNHSDAPADDDNVSCCCNDRSCFCSSMSRSLWDCTSPTSDGIRTPGFSWRGSWARSGERQVADWATPTHLRCAWMLVSVFARVRDLGHQRSSPSV